MFQQIERDDVARASWFETRYALLTMRVSYLILRSIAKAMRLEG
jgi:hypothetical protein